MTRFRCIPVATDTVTRFRRTGLDDGGNAIRRVVVTDASGAPCREPMLLGSYHLPRPRGIYWTPSPIFLHAEACPPFAAADVVAPIIAGGSLVSVRAYDGSDQCLYDLGHVGAGAAVDAPLRRALDDERTAFVNVHTARPGCLLARVEKVPGA